MSNTQDTTSKKSNILIIGDGGSHKTWLTGSIPGIYIFDFDAGTSILRDKSVEFDTFKDLPRDWKVDGAEAEWYAKQGIHPFGNGWDMFYKKFREKTDLIRKGDPKAPKAFGFDSLTTMSMLAVNDILLDTGHAAPHQGTWGAHHEYFKTIFSVATALPIRFICTAHIERNQNDLTGVTEKLPLLTGKLASLVNIFFDEVYFTNSEVDKDGKMKFWINTQRTPSMTLAKSRWGVPDKTATEWSEIEKFLPK